MRTTKEEQIEAFKELIDLANDNDLELVEAVTCDEHTTDSLDAINILTFRSFNDFLDKEAFEKDLRQFEDPNEFATFKLIWIEDVLVLFIYI